MILTYGLPLILPTVLFLLWARFAPRHRVEGEEIEQVEIPWLWLVGVGVLLAGLSIGAFTLHDGASPGAAYEPAYVDKDGKLVPGQFKK